MKAVRQRWVFFVGGFDPKGASSFYQEHKASCAEHSARHGGSYQFSHRAKRHPWSHAWTIQNDHADGTVTTEFEYLAWDDLVRAQWARTTGAVVRQAWECLRDFISTGTIKRMYAMSKSVVRAALFPYALVAGTATAVLLLAAGAAALADAAGLAKSAVAAIACGVLLVASWAAFKWLHSVPSTWFLRVVSFARSYANASQVDHPMQLRIRDWSQHVQTQLKNNDPDEILLVGYSAGSILSMALMARLVRDAPDLAQRITMVTLGNCIPATAGLPNAEHVRADLHALGLSNTRWVDISSPIDWGSFALNDTVSAIAGGNASSRRKCLSPQWHLLFSPSNYQQLKKDKYRVHKQYLQTTEILGTYDYFAITCGPLSIHQRFFAS